MSAKISYEPGESGDPEEIDFLGQHWVAGKQVTVADDVAVRLLGHPHFKRDDKAQEREDAERAAAAQAEADRLDAEKRKAAADKK